MAKRKRLVANDLPRDYADMSKRDQMRALSDISRATNRKPRESKPSEARTPQELLARRRAEQMINLAGGASDVIYMSDLEDVLKVQWDSATIKPQDVVIVFGANEGNVSTGTNKPNAGQALAAFRLKEAGFTVIGIPTRGGGIAGGKITYLQDDFLDGLNDRWKNLANEQISKITQAKSAGKVIVFPKDGIGTGYAKLKTSAPRIAKILDTALAKLGINNATGMNADDFSKFEAEARTPRTAPDIQKGMRGEDAFYYHYTEAGNGDLIAKGSIKPDADGRIYFFDKLEAVNEKIFEEISTQRALDGKETSGGYDIVAIPRSDLDVYEPRPDIAAPDSSAMYVEPKAEIRISDPYIMPNGQDQFVKPTPPPEIPQKISETAPPPRGVVDAVVAVAKLDKNGKVEGGTGWATEGALLRGIPTYVYDEMTNRWYTASSPQKSFQGWTPVDAPPTNVRSIAGIGTRTLSERGYQEIVAYVESLDKSVVIHSGGAGGSDTAFEETHSKRGGEVVSHSFEGHSRPSKAGGQVIHSRNDLVSTRAEVDAIGRSLGKSITWDKPDRRPGDKTEELVMRNMFQIEPGRVVPAQAEQAATTRVPEATPNSKLNASAIANNIYSSSGKSVPGMSEFERALRAALTNPTNDLTMGKDPKSGMEYGQDSYANKSISTKYPVVYEGKIFPSAEHAFFYYQNELNLSDSPKLNETVAKNNLARAEELMSKIIAEKLRQHPKLLKGIETLAERSGMTPEEWIAKQSHYTGKASNRQPSHWTGDGLASGFLRALSLGYSMAKAQPQSMPSETNPAKMTKAKIIHDLKIKWAQSRENWEYFPKIDRYGKFRSKQLYYVSGTIDAAVSAAASAQTRAAMASTVEEKTMFENQAKRLLESKNIDSSIQNAWVRMTELAVGKVSDPTTRTRLARTIGATAAFGTYYDSPVEEKLAQLDPSVKGKTIPNIIADVAARNGVDLSLGASREIGIPGVESKDTMQTKAGIEETMRTFVVALRALADSKRKFNAVGIGGDSRLGKGGTLSDKDARDLAMVIMKISSILKDYADPALAIESQKMQRFGGEGRRGTLSPGAELASKLVARGEALSQERIDEISKFNRRQAEAYARAMGIELGNISETSKAYNRPLIGEEQFSLPEQRFVDALTETTNPSERKFQAAVEESYSFRPAPGERITDGNKITKAIIKTMRYFPALAERVVPTPSGYTRSARGTSKPIFQLNSGYSPNFASNIAAEPDANLFGPTDDRVSGAVERESAATKAFAAGQYNDKVVLVRLGNILKSDLKVGRAQVNLFDELVRNYLAGDFAAARERAAKTIKLVGPIAELTETGLKEIDPVEVAAKYREKPSENLLRKLNTIEIALDFETARKMGIIGPKGNSLPGLFATTVTGTMSPQTYVSSKVRVLPGGAVVSTDPAYIEAYGFPKVLPYVVEPTGDEKNPFILKQIEVPERGVETATSAFVPTKSGGDKAKNIDYRQEQLLREARSGGKAVKDIALAAEELQGGLPKGRENTFDTDRKARLDFIIDQIDILAETPSSWTSKEIFDQSMNALRENMTEFDFRSMVSGSADGASDIVNSGVSSRWYLAKKFSRMVALWDSPERDVTFAEASRRWTAISGKNQYTNFAEAAGGAYPVEPTTTEAERMFGADFSQPEPVAPKKPGGYMPMELVRINDGEGKSKIVSASSEAARKYYLEGGEILGTARTDLSTSDTLVSKSTDVTAKYPTIFVGDRSQAIDDILIATDEISRLAYRLAYALGYGTDLQPLGADPKQSDVRVMQAIASTVSSLIDSEYVKFAEIFKTPTNLSAPNYQRQIVPDFEREAEVQLDVLKRLEERAQFREIVDPETGMVLEERPTNLPEPADVKSFTRAQLEARILQIEEAAGSAKNPTELALLRRQYEALLRGERVPDFENIIKEVSTVTVKPEAAADVTVKLGRGVVGDPVEEIAGRLAATMLGNEDPDVLRNVLGRNRLLDLFNEGPAEAAAAIIRRAWVLYGQNATPDLAKALSFNYNGREYYGTMGVGTDGRPIMAVQPKRTNETFVPAENPLQAEPSVRQDTEARRALIVEAEKNVRARQTEPALTNRQTSDTLDYLRAEDRERMVVIRKRQPWNAVREQVLRLFSQIDVGKLDATIRVFVNDFLADYVGPDGKPVTYEEVLAKINMADLVKSGPYSITYRLFDHGMNGNFKDIEKFIAYTQDVRETGDSVALGGRYARDLGIDPETGKLIVGGEDAPEFDFEQRTQGEINTESRSTSAELATGPLPEDGGYHPAVGSADHDAMVAYEQGKMFAGLGLPWTQTLSKLGRPLREAPGSMKAMHGRGGFGAGFAADAAYMAWKGYLDPTTLAVSAGFNSMNFLPIKYAPKVGLIGAAANLGLSAVTGADMGRAAMMTIGGLLGGAVGAFGGGFGAIGGSFAGSEIADFIWSDVFGNKNKQQQQGLPSLDPMARPLKITPRITP